MNIKSILASGIALICFLAVMGCIPETITNATIAWSLAFAGWLFIAAKND